MARYRLTARVFPAGSVWPQLLIGVVVLMCVGLGCAGKRDAAGEPLDSTLVRTERLLDRGNVVEARERLLTGLASASGEWKGMQAAGAYRMLGDLSLATAHLDSAMLYYRRAEESYRGRLQRYEAFQMSLANVGILRLMQREDDARIQAAEALRLAALFGDSAAVTDIRWALLDVYRVLEQPADMAIIAAGLRATCQRSGDLRGEARTSFLLGKAASELGNADDAAANLLQCITLAGRAKDSALVSQALLVLARTFEHSGRVREAQESYATALQNSSSNNPRSSLHMMLRIGNFYLRNKRPDIAATYFQNASIVARSTSNALAHGYALLQWGHSLGAGTPVDADSLFRRGYDALRTTMHARGCTYALISLGQVAERENKVTDAAQFYRAAVKAQESAYASRAADDIWLECEEAVFGRGGGDAYTAMVSLLLQTGKTEEAFWYQERCNARRLSDDLASWNVRTGVYATDSTLHNYLHRRALHIGAERQLEELASSPQGTASLLKEVHGVLNHLEETITMTAERTRHIDPRLAAIANTDGISIAEVQKCLTKDAALLMYLPTHRAFYACVVTPAGSTVSMASVGQERVVELAEQYLRECALRAATADSMRQFPRGQDLRIQELTRSLYEAMVLPVELALKPGVRLLIVLPSRMPAFPLAGLRRGGSERTPTLIERVALSYLPSARFVTMRKPAPAPIRTVVALGTRGSTSWDVEYELRDINAFYRDARMFFGKDATLATLRSIRTDLLHLAVEVRFTSHRPLTGVMTLGDGISLDGTMPVPIETIFSIPPVPAVVVSNISSRLPTADRALAAAFLANGSASVVLNAAPLTRKAKKVFGENFYTALQTGSSVPVALRTAQDVMARSRELSAPNFWAPLMVWGE